MDRGRGGRWVTGKGFGGQGGEVDRGPGGRWVTGVRVGGSGSGGGQGTGWEVGHW